ncbi:PREDICTED: uncharacterized protein LOC105575081 [Cercocebus atys]|uniref:uncharacterized protein LOC105575081 n=1 Tax=Cercocebus atys TaxID=9531 RepID=UPI0005F3D618|nr:PREDICTED: uncharacterized protein LOC105575081 [Cercocebus atys]XP_011891962.1 PREDICTED: uncharacterized protein LOC105575081 [Cercocebus atys]
MLNRPQKTLQKKENQRRVFPVPAMKSNIFLKDMIELRIMEFKMISVLEARSPRSRHCRFGVWIQMSLLDWRLPETNKYLVFKRNPQSPRRASEQIPTRQAWGLCLVHLLRVGSHDLLLGTRRKRGRG